MIFTPEQASAMRTLARVWSTERFVLIGASALACQRMMGWRQTRDLDLVLAVSFENYPAGLEKEPGWSRDPKREHRWIGPGGVYIDVIPAESQSGEEAILRWPESGSEMNLVGFRLAFEQATSIEVDPGLTVRAAPTEVIALLKMVAYLDRPYERDRDLADIAHILDEYIPASDDRRYSDDVLDAELTYEEVSPFLLGQQLATIVNEAEKRLVLSFIEKMINAEDAAGAQAQMLSVAPPSWHREPDALNLRFMALRRGLESR